MANYSFRQLEGLWEQAGGPHPVAPVAAAIALAESSGNPNAINATDNNGTQTSWGLWQISDGTHRMPVPNILNPQVNAKQAVAKYRGAGGSFKPWGTFNTGAYLKFLPKGQAPAAANVPASASGGSAGTGGGGSAQQAVGQAQLDVFNPGDVANLLDPFQLVQAAGQAAGRAISSMISNPASLVTSVATLAKDFNALANLANAALTSVLWLFKPSHWVRIFAFSFGVMFLLPGVWMLSKAGQGEGDISLALGILLVMIAGMLLFVAFHNLPDDVRNLQDLLGYVSGEIRANSPATTH